MYRWRIPVRSTIQASSVSTIFASSSFVRIFSGTLIPHPVMWA
jgi:hypothetical protein